MPTPVSEGLHAINDYLHTVLASWVEDPGAAGTLQFEALTLLLTRLNIASQLLGGIAPGSPSDSQLEEEILTYRSNVEKLQELLPLIHRRLLADKARLEKARAHLQAATAWSDARNKIL
jgi:hypothetical protein